MNTEMLIERLSSIGILTITRLSYPDLEHPLGPYDLKLDVVGRLSDYKFQVEAATLRKGLLAIMNEVLERIGDERQADEGVLARLNGTP